MEKIAAIVVTYNRKDLLKNLLKALMAQTRTLDSIIIIDNASTDGTDTLLARERGKNRVIDYIRMEDNNGGSGGFHAGVKTGFEEGFDWLWLMDDDVAPEVDCLENLLRRRGESKALVPRRIFPGAPVDPCMAIKINLDRFFPLRLKEELISGRFRTAGELPEVLEVQDFSFEGPLFHRDIIQKIGCPSGNFFIFCDDTEFAIKIRLSGERILLIRDAVIRRMMPLVAGECGWRDYYSWRNIFHLYRKYGRTSAVRQKPLVIFFGTIVKRTFKGKFGFNDFKILFNATVDAYLGRFPKRYLPKK